MPLLSNTKQAFGVHQGVNDALGILNKLRRLITNADIDSTCTFYEQKGIH